MAKEQHHHRQIQYMQREPQREQTSISLVPFGHMLQETLNRLDHVVTAKSPTPGSTITPARLDRIRQQMDFGRRMMNELTASRLSGTDLDQRYTNQRLREIGNAVTSELQARAYTSIASDTDFLFSLQEIRIDNSAQDLEHMASGNLLLVLSVLDGLRTENQQVPVTERVSQYNRLLDEFDQISGEVGEKLFNTSPQGEHIDAMPTPGIDEYPTDHGTGKDISAVPSSNQKHGAAVRGEAVDAMPTRPEIPDVPTDQGMVGSSNIFALFDQLFPVTEVTGTHDITNAGEVDRTFTPEEMRNELYQMAGSLFLPLSGEVSFSNTLSRVFNGIPLRDLDGLQYWSEGETQPYVLRFTPHFAAMSIQVSHGPTALVFTIPQLITDEETFRAISITALPQANVSTIDPAFSLNLIYSPAMDSFQTAGEGRLHTPTQDELRNVVNMATVLTLVSRDLGTFGGKSRFISPSTNSTLPPPLPYPNLPTTKAA